MYLALALINMHVNFDKLSLLVEEVIQQSPLNGHLIVFRNR
ncbi:MAG: IS66 family insertion sequence element accessory protein TnpB [Gammaproteobacteria bacterium]|nr:IS66 family insertion sequence element accessory protein TnpB [Gammaproteobacteria bacterium]